MQEGEWEIFHYDNSNFYKPCICGHRVKRITYLYDRISRKIMFIGTTCVKQYGISNHVKNRILIQVLKENIFEFDKENLEKNVRTFIQSIYNKLKEKLKASYHIEIDYYDIVAPFNRLLVDVYDLVTDYKFDLILLLNEIQKDVESMNVFSQANMVDEYNSDSEDDYEEFLEPNNFVQSSREYETESISEFSVETSDSIHETCSVISFANSEFSIDTIIEDGPKALPIAIADAFCSDPNCSPNLHSYCELKIRINRFKENIIQHRKDIQMIYDELQPIIDKSNNIVNHIREQCIISQKCIDKFQKKHK